MAQLVTYALPYANGPLHLGHLVGLIQTDIWVRTQRLLGNTCYFVCGDDAHGTPIMIKAASEGLTPEAFAEQIFQGRAADLAAFNVDCDNYYTTHSPENEAFASLIYTRLQERGDIEKRTIMQAFDPVEKMFLPDRYVRGDCPRCGASDQYGDNCESCGATYTPTELKNPKSTLSGATPEQKETEHYFFELANHEAMLHEWTRSGHLQQEVTNKLDEWFEHGLHAWDITRDAPYFGFNIPGHTDKYFYVWLDAPIGYMASFKHFCDQTGIANFDEFWGKDSEHELYHFIGKDIIYFHALFWPAMLKGADFRTPTAVYAHGYMTVNGKKMSKSRGTFITAKQYAEHCQGEYFRYYLAARLNGHLDDLDFSFADFTARVNADLVGKVVNIASRSAKFINKSFDNQISRDNANPALTQDLLAAGEVIIEHLIGRDYARAVREIMALADKVNQYIDHEKPWVLAKETGKEAEVQAVCSVALECFRILVLYLKPILPIFAENVEQFLKIEPLTWASREDNLFGRSIDTFKPLLQRIDPAQLEALAEHLA